MVVPPSGSIAASVRSATPKAPNRYTELSQMVTRSGLMRRRYGYYWTKLVAAPVAIAGVLTGFILIGDTWWQLVTAAVLAVVLTQVAMLGHDAAHRQIFRSGRWNDWTTLVIGNLLVGMSYGWWQHKHTRHHANPNKIGSDPDIELPVIAFTPEQADRRRGSRSGPLRWLIAHQGVLFFPILLLEGLSLHASSVRRVFAREPLRRRPMEIVFLTVRIVGLIVLVFLVLSPGIAFAFIGVQLGVFCRGHLGPVVERTEWRTTAIAFCLDHSRHGHCSVTVARNARAHPRCSNPRSARRRRCWRRHPSSRGEDSLHSVDFRM